MESISDLFYLLLELKLFIMLHVFKDVVIVLVSQIQYCKLVKTCLEHSIEIYASTSSALFYARFFN